MRALRVMLAMSFAAAPVALTVSSALTVFVAIISPLMSYGVKRFVDGIAGGGSGAAGLVVLAIAALAVLVAAEVNEMLSRTTLNRVGEHLRQETLRMVTSVPTLAVHEDPVIADHLTTLTRDARRLSRGIDAFVALVLTVAISATTVLLLVGVHPLLALLPVLGLGRLSVTRRAARRQIEASRVVAAPSRLKDKLCELAESPEHGMELRTFGLAPVLAARMPELYRRQNEPRLAASWWAGRMELAARLLYGLVYGIAVLWVLHLAQHDRASVGDVAMVVLLAPQADRLVSQFTGSIGQLITSLESFRILAELRAYAAGQRRGTLPAPERLTDGIRLRGVGFTYPGAARPSLRDIDLDLRPSSTVALVGENGAGKSTLVNLLAGLHEPSEGELTVDGQSLPETDPAAWRSRISAGFQDFVPYEFLARENVGVGDLPRLDDRIAVTAALERGDATGLIDGLPAGLETQLGTRFTGGVDLSGGQWQRLALARAFMRERPLLLLLDEPTAALDPETEHRLFGGFAAAARAAASETGGITVLVSHRFSTVRMADRIVVLDAGRVLEQGSHEELMAAGGRYAELFELQARAYR